MKRQTIGGEKRSINAAENKNEPLQIIDEMMHMQSGKTSADPTPKTNLQRKNSQKQVQIRAQTTNRGKLQQKRKFYETSKNKELLQAQQPLQKHPTRVTDFSHERLELPISKVSSRISSQRNFSEEALFTLIKAVNKSKERKAPDSQKGENRKQRSQN